MHSGNATLEGSRVSTMQSGCLKEKHPSRVSYTFRLLIAPITPESDVLYHTTPDLYLQSSPCDTAVCLGEFSDRTSLSNQDNCVESGDICRTSRGVTRRGL